MQDALKGNKTYVLAGLWVLFGVAQSYLDGTLDAATIVPYILEGGLLASFRAALAKIG